ncbi:MAG: ATP-binding cassette domain-containing protein [Steroidobacteraceae bacterium]
MSTLELRSVTLSVPGRPLIGPLDISIKAGEIVSLLGPSGAGKSSLLAFLCGVLPRDFTAQGQVLLDGQDLTVLPPQRRGLGVLFQDDLLFPHLSVAGNLAFGLRHAAQSRRARTRLIEEALDSFGIEGFAARDPATLSGGQRARVALLRVLLSRPKVLLLDEPFAHLDPSTRQSVRELVFEEARRRQLATVLVTHDAEDVVAAGGTCLQLSAGEAGVECSTPASNA